MPRTTTHKGAFAPRRIRDRIVCLLNKMKTMANVSTSVKRSPAKKTRSTVKEKDEHAVITYMKKLKHPLKIEFEEVRNIIKSAHKNLEERIKWNAPSYHIDNVDLVTFNAWAKKQVHLVFHHPEIVNITSRILEGDYPTRRMVYFNSMQEVKEKKTELQKVIRTLIKKNKLIVENTDAKNNTFPVVRQQR